jgi:hypothetical protein
VTMIEEARLVESIAMQLAEIGDREDSDILLYAEAGRGWMGGSIFFARSEVVVWHSPGGTEIPTLVKKLWTLAPQDKKWRGMTMTLSGDKFRIEFDYGETWLKDETANDRREPIVRAYFGDKAIHYPPLKGAEPWPGE